MLCLSGEIRAVGWAGRGGGAQQIITAHQLLCQDAFFLFVGTSREIFVILSEEKTCGFCHLNIFSFSFLSDIVYSNLIVYLYFI